MKRLIITYALTYFFVMITWFSIESFQISSIIGSLYFLACILIIETLKLPSDLRLYSNILTGCQIFLLSQVNIYFHIYDSLPDLLPFKKAFISLVVIKLYVCFVCTKTFRFKRKLHAVNLTIGSNDESIGQSSKK